MDPGDPTSILFTKIRTLEPDFASKIIGYLLLQDLGKRDLMRLALGPDTLLQSVCLKAKSALGLNGSSSSSASTPLNPISRPINIHRHSPRTPPGNGFVEFSRNPSLNTSGSLGSNPNMISSPFQTSSSLFASDGGGGGSGDATAGNGDLLDEQQLGNYLSFLNDSSSKNNSDESLDPFGFSADSDDAHLHKRSFSASDACFGSEEHGFGGGGYNRFTHGGGLGDDFDSPGGFGSRDYICRQQEEFLRMKMVQRQRMAAAQYLAASGSPMSYDKGINFLLHRNAHRSGAAQYGEEGYWFGSPGRHEREDFMGLGDKSNSASKQIYLTFPADSSFTDEDVSNYFGNFGPVQDVRIPYQQKRMFGFVTFVHSETVRIILARGNPHFICDSRVLVKPYKEKGRILENRRQQQQLLQQMERANFSPGSSPSGMDSRDLFDCHLAPRMFSNTQEMLRRKAEQADLQQAIEFQRRRFLNLQLPDMESESFHNHQRSLSIGSPVHFPSRANQSMLFRSDSSCEEVIEGNGDSGHFQSEASQAFPSDADHNNCQEHGYNNNVSKGQETSLENVLPDSFFASPSTTGETQQPESEKEICATLSVTTENQPASTLQSA